MARNSTKTTSFDAKLASALAESAKLHGKGNTPSTTTKARVYGDDVVVTWVGTHQPAPKRNGRNPYPLYQAMSGHTIGEILAAGAKAGISIKGADWAFDSSEQARYRPTHVAPVIKLSRPA